MRNHRPPPTSTKHNDAGAGSQRSRDDSTKKCFALVNHDKPCLCLSSLRGSDIPSAWPGRHIASSLDHPLHRASLFEARVERVD